ncbi:hypothetical protein CAEBREN_11222 [Caenorhabditis brenneri]|uniref:Uncharacterized protein n=1 Tax=Caenorhabditis brenneri TaxID=135651 RepID=G0PAW8_CAEBE|nr:hypothetical protein CAEBREN_11222 [Caenorhabditis brenneri]
MEFGAANAYDKIDEKVKMTLKEAAKVLKQLEENKNDKSVFSVHSSSSYESRKTISIGSTHHSSDQQPRATIRTPKDTQKASRSLFFPEAKINAKTTSLMYSTSNTGTTDVSSIDPVTPTPDSLFPEAIYIPAGTKSSEIKMLIGSSVSSRESVRAVKTTGHGCHMQKLAVEPLEDIRQLKCRGLPKSKPDSLFPKATYESGPEKILAISPVTSSIVTTDESCNLTTITTTNSSNLDVQPIEFFSADGRIKMMLQPVAEKNKRKQPKAAPATEEYTVPKQLQSSTRLKTIENPRAKFSTNFTIFDNSIDLSGIFNGNSMKKRDLSKLVINGKSYST